MYSIDTQEQISDHMRGFDVIWRWNQFRVEPIGRAESGEAQEWKGRR